MVALSYLLGIARYVLLATKSVVFPYKYFIDQAGSVKMTGYWFRSLFLRVYSTSASSRTINFANIPPY